MSSRRALVYAGWLALAGVTAVLWLVGCFRYTSVGLDHNVSTGTDGLLAYYRLRWPGDGSVWIGRSSHHVPRSQLSRYPFEPGGRLLAAPVVPRPSSPWNRAGFWLVTEVENDPLGVLNWPDPVQSQWIGVPGWLPALLLLGLAWRARRRASEPRK